MNIGTLGCTQSPEDIVLISDDDDILEQTVENPQPEFGTTATVVEGEASLFLSRHCDGHSDTEEIIQACSHTPFCLYLYTDLKLHDGRCFSAILVGYFSQRSGVGVVRLLHTLALSTGLGTLDTRRLIGTLNRLRLPMSNLVMFYSNIHQPELRDAVVSELRRFSPKLLSLCGLPSLTSRASSAGLLPYFGGVVTLVRDIHKHCSTSTSVHDTLKELFANADLSECGLVLRSVQRMVSCWREMLLYFRSLKGHNDAERIRAQLRDHRVRLDFLFLSHALEPLRILQDVQRSGTLLVVDQFQLLAVVARSYAERFLRPSAIEVLLKRWDEDLLHNKAQLLSLTEVNLSAEARDFLWATPEVDLNKWQRCDFLRRARAFYGAVLKSIVDNAPKPLDATALKSISSIVKLPDSSRDGELFQKTLPALAVQLGVCLPGSVESRRLASDYLRLIQSETSRARMEGGPQCWARVLQRMRPSPLHRLLLTLLALPSSLDSDQVFSKMLSSAKGLEKEQPTASSSSCRRRAVVSLGQQGARRGHGCSSGDEDESSSDDSHPAAAKPALNPQLKTYSKSMEDSDDEISSDASDVVCVTQTSAASPPVSAQLNGQRDLPAQCVHVLSSDEDHPSTEAEAHHFGPGRLVWGRVPGFSPWPGVVLPSVDQNHQQDIREVRWYGQNMTSQVNVKSLTPFEDFMDNFCHQSFSVLEIYRDGLQLALQEMAKRKSKTFAPDLQDRAVLLTEMVDWASGGFKDPHLDTSCAGTNKSRRAKKTRPVFFKAKVSPSGSKDLSSQMKSLSVSLTRLSRRFIQSHLEASAERERVGDEGESSKKDERKDVERGWRRMKRSRGWREEQRQKSSFYQSKKLSREYSKVFNRVNRTTSVYKQPDQKLRAETIQRIRDSNLDIEGFCLCCGTEDVVISHPLFKGSLCCKCKDNFAETVYRYDEDGYQSYCTVCCYGMEVVLCGNDSCCRSFCQNCVNILVGPGAFDSVKTLDPWMCYMCQPQSAHGALEPRLDWSTRVQQLFTNTTMEFEPHRVYPSVPANLRRPLRILSLFDGIATGFVVLKELGFKVDKYVASEICKDSIAVSTINHEGKILHVGDVRSITKTHLDSWGPFDLLIGGSPCNDLACVNPIRKGLYEGSGRLFFDFYRILQLLKPKEEDPRPFFWLFENVVHMNMCDKLGICRFLECNPVLVDAVLVSPAHRARYFWGNIPGMSRPITASQSDRLCLQDCLELGREARVTKVRTITTNGNSLKQNAESSMPVLQSGQEDTLWITELERIFGFPKHYTDVRNMNKQQRQRVLGRSWSVPVIRHLLSPLKDYYACEELLQPMSSSSFNHAPSSTSTCTLNPNQDILLTPSTFKSAPTPNTTPPTPNTTPPTLNTTPPTLNSTPNTTPPTPNTTPPTLTSTPNLKSSPVTMKPTSTASTSTSDSVSALNTTSQPALNATLNSSTPP